MAREIPIDDPVKPTRALNLRVQTEDLLDRACSLSLNLSGDESVYGLHYIGEKLAQCASGLETLSDISMSLVKVQLELSRQVSELSSLLRSKEMKARLDPAFLDIPRSGQTVWIQQKVEVCRRELEEWQLTSTWVSEIRAAVNDRIALFKRLDSDIRLQHKLLEAKQAVGAGTGFSPASQAGITDSDIDDL